MCSDSFAQYNRWLGEDVTHPSVVEKRYQCAVPRKLCIRFITDNYSTVNHVSLTAISHVFILKKQQILANNLDQTLT